MNKMIHMHGVTTCADVCASIKAILESRGELLNPFDLDELSRHSDKVGPIDPVQLERARMNMSFGTAKEPYAIEAFSRALASQLYKRTIEETGFMSCATHIHRCAARLIQLMTGAVKLLH